MSEESRCAEDAAHKAAAQASDEARATLQAEVDSLREELDCARGAARSLDERLASASAESVRLREALAAATVESAELRASAMAAEAAAETASRKQESTRRLLDLQVREQVACLSKIASHLTPA